MALNTRYDKGDEITVTLPVGAVSGDPVVLGTANTIIGVVQADRMTNGDHTGKGTVKRNGSHMLTVKGIDGSGNSAVAEFDLIYYVAADTPKLSKKATGVLFGIALTALASGATGEVEVLLAAK